jgi:hypothetical protein
MQRNQCPLWWTLLTDSKGKNKKAAVIAGLQQAAQDRIWRSKNRTFILR